MWISLSLSPSLWSAAIGTDSWTGDEEIKRDHLELRTFDADVVMLTIFPQAVDRHQKT